MYFLYGRIGRVMISVLASSAVDRRFDPRSGQNKDYKIGILYPELSFLLRYILQDFCKI